MPTHRLPSLSVLRSSVPMGKPALITGIGYSQTLPVLGSILPRNCSRKCENQIMRSESFSRQVVFGDDDAGRAAGRPRQGLERVAPGLVGAEIDRGEVVRHRLHARRLAE